MAKKKKVVIDTSKEWSYSEKLKCNIYNDDVMFTYEIPENIEIHSIAVDAWIYTENKDRYEVYIKAVIDLNHEKIYQTNIAKTAQGTAWSSGIYSPNEIIKDGVINIQTVGSSFKKGLNITLIGKINE